jgi:5-methyltetrahydrofolate--homocysteine methyltransferase
MEVLMPDIALRLADDVLVLDGAMGSLLLAEGIEADAHPMFSNIADADLIRSIHKRYLLAGAQAITTNSFGGSKTRLAAHGLADLADELNRAAVKIARSCGAQHVLADVGPCGLLMAPFGTARFDQVFSEYAEQISSLAAEEPDAILIETMIDIADARAAVMAARSVCRLPVFVTISCNEQGVMPLSGTDPATAAVILQAAGADAIGLNCGVGIEAMLPLVEEMATVTDLPLIAQPNLGLPKTLPNGQPAWDGSADQMAEAAWTLRQLGVSMIGSCCGSTPTHTAAVFAAVGLTDSLLAGRSDRSGLVLACPGGHVRIAVDQPCKIIGERITPTNNPRLTADLAAGDLTRTVDLAIKQVQAGADLIDVNINAGEIDIVAVLPALVSELGYSIRAPLVFDCQNPKALEAALSVYPGRALINSVNASKQSLDRVLPLARRFGAAVIAMCTNGRELPASVQQRVDLALRIREAAHLCGLTDDDLLYDVLALAAVAADTAFDDAVAAVAALSARGMLTVLAVSNISFKLEERSEMNARFTAAVIEAGLSAVILNPNDNQVMTAFHTASEKRDQSLVSAGSKTRRQIAGQLCV